jgi:hypothetical protein
MANITIGFPNRIDSATLSGGGWETTLPQSNIKDRRLSELARSTGVANATITIDLGSAKTIGILGIAAHNISAVGKVRLAGNSSSSFGSPIYDSGLIDAYPSGAIPQELLEWEDDNFWLGTISAQAIAGYRSPYILVIPSKPVLRYWQITFSDATNSDGYLQMGRVFIGDAWTAEYNYNFGANLAFNDPSVIEESLGGQEYYDARKNPRVHSFDLQNLTDTEAYARVVDMQRYAGVTGEVLVVPDSDDTSNGFRRNFLGRMMDLNGFSDADYDRRSASFRIKETY